MRKQKTRPTTPEQEAYYQRSDENLARESAMIAEMEAGGLKVYRQDTMMGCIATLVTPEVIHFSTVARHSYFPNAVRELYEKWKEQADGRASTLQV